MKNEWIKAPIVSVVMSVYNVQDYIEEAIQCLLDQTIGFEANIELIIVNDGSTDRSGEIAKQFAEKYPNNILYISKENGGQSSARNAGLTYVRGKYVNFLDPDDTVSINAFEEVVRFFENNYQSVDMVCLPLYYFGAMTGIHGKYKNLGDRNRMIDLTKTPADFILSSASSFYKSQVFDTLRFDEKLMTEEDTKINLSIVKRQFKIGYVCEKKVKYNYRKRDEGGSNVDILSSGGNYDALMAPIYIFEDLLGYDDELSSYEKELVVYELRSRLKVIKKELLTEEEYENIISAYSKWIKKLDTEFIIHSKWLETIEKKVLFLNLSERTFSDVTRKGYLPLTDRLVNISAMDEIHGDIHLTCRYNNFGEDEFELVIASKDDKEIIYPNKSIDVEGPYDLVYGEFRVDMTHVRDFILPYKSGTYNIYYLDKKTNALSLVRRLRISNRSRICSEIQGVGPVCNGFCFSIKNENIYITDDINTIIGMTDKLRKEAGTELFGRTLNGDKKYILINDRPEKAGDNGEALFIYIMENETDIIRDRTYFVLNKSCGDYRRLLKYKDHIVQFRSIDHLEKFVNAKVILSSHQSRAFYYPFDEKMYKYYADLLKYKFIWLQHGVTKDDLQKEANKLNGLNDGVVTTTVWETKEFSKECYLYNNSEILPVGFPRFDILDNYPERLITIAPTWRKELVGRILPNGHNEADEKFITSDFYENYIGLLMHPTLLNMLREHGYKLDFVLHSGFTVYETVFDKINCDVVRLRKMDDFSYQEAFSKSSLFVTDFSSTAFDFAYLGKPVIYFQFDEDTFFDKHYHQSDWNYREDGLGPVINTIDEALEQICFYIKNDCKMEMKYRERADATFLYHDRDNCKRLVEAVRDILIEDISIVSTEAHKNILKQLKNLQDEIEAVKKERENMKRELDYANYCLDETRKSFSYRLGYKLTALPRKLRGLRSHE